MNQICGLKQMLKKKYQISEYILSSAENNSYL